MAWEYDRDTKQHMLPIEDGAGFVLVYKSGGGDYAITAMREGDASGGDVAYEETLAKAKKFAEHLAQSGLYVEYLGAE